MIQGLLETNGFRVKIMGAYEAHYPPTYPIEIQVPEGEADDARRLLDAHEHELETEDEDADDADDGPSVGLQVFGVLVALIVLGMLYRTDLLAFIDMIRGWF